MSSSTSRSTSKYPEASGVFHRPLVAKLLRLVFDTAALQGSVGMRPKKKLSQEKARYIFRPVIVSNTHDLRTDFVFVRLPDWPER